MIPPLDHATYWEQLSAKQQCALGAYKNAQPSYELEAAFGRLPHFSAFYDVNMWLREPSLLFECDAALRDLRDTVDSLFTYELLEEMTLYRAHDGRYIQSDPFTQLGWMSAADDEEATHIHFRGITDRVLLVIRCPARKNVALMESNPEHGNELEREVLLPRECTFRMTNTKPGPTYRTLAVDWL